MIVPNLTRGAHARVLHVLMRATELSEQAITAAFMDADRGRHAMLDQSVTVRKSAYRATAYGLKDAEQHQPPITGRQTAAAIAAAHGLPADVGGIMLGAAIGLRLGLEVRLSRTRSKQHRRPKLATKVARFSATETDAESARRWAQEIGRAARKQNRW